MGDKPVITKENYQILEKKFRKLTAYIIKRDNKEENYLSLETKTSDFLNSIDINVNDNFKLEGKKIGFASEQKDNLLENLLKEAGISVEK